ncbi:endonuclease/exonuclease/phosphatase family protein [Actinomadura sp. NEAU-AAG7]|uniref:endonuclease/exonuclease/phosphatase family protein n=1 Tax=Actinomadura sp. NEAU-AAG7 TaxID=2839640 RepID=UPI001BE4708C|nr:endonuclease/exonuclease/phosphatase family protein [Actinomadura sp. NEAU-AAG7]MBT2209683.1 endonuclease/exonuclease/phosphatase family protein [Actinomadura sp. NEAU-AAG7]
MTGAPARGSGVRVLSYNVRSLRDDPAAVARVVRGIGPDLLLLQEVPRFWDWRVKRRRLARACRMEIAAGRRACGLAVLAAPGVRRVGREFHLLSPVPGLHRRGLAIAVVEVGGARLVAASTHLDLMEAPRLRHTREVLGHLERARDRYGAPVVLAGDINEEPGGPSWTMFTGTFQDAHAVAPDGGEPTFSARDPRRRIDAVFADPPVEVLACGVPPDPDGDHERATDHRPLRADLRLPAGS